MGRANRVIFEGAIYHVIIRGNNKEYIFQNPKHKSFIIKQLREYQEILDFDLLAYVIMNNHYHFIIRTKKISISKVMFYINNTVGKYLCRELKWSGHIFDKRYTCKIVSTDIYLLWLLRYIHRNPIRAGLCENLNDYRWSSHYFYMRGLNSFVNTEFILNMLSPHKAAAQMRYLKLVNMAGDDSNPTVDQEAIEIKYGFKGVPQDLACTDPDYIATSNEIPLLQSTRNSLDNIFNLLNLDEQTKKLLLSGSKKTSLTNYKLQFIKEALRNKYTIEEISLFLNVKRNSISIFCHVTMYK